VSGLAALFHRDGRPVDRAAVAAMLAVVPYRGPDGQSLHLWPTVGLGHARLAVTPEEQCEVQPLVSPRSGCAVVADARLDNRDQLLAKLPDSPPLATSDAELILRAYEVWGFDAAAQLLGDFAFVIWDPRHQRIVCARDTSGQRTLYYRLDARTFAAGSEIEQLFQDPSVPVEPNEDRIRDYLVPFRVLGNEQEQPTTFYKGICAVLAGSVLVLDASSDRTWAYWRLSPPEIRYRHDSEYAQHFGNLLAEAVRCRLRSSHPVAASLSGGLDSTSIVSLAQSLYQIGAAENHGFMTFSLLFDGLDCDETPFIRDVQSKYGFDARYLPASSFPTSFFDPQPSVFMRGPGMPEGPMDIMLNAASRAGARVMLTGALADNCFPWSWNFFASLLRRGRVG
jgi:asparagine synthase (glutamine-hydrolysing)